ncbi:MAG: phosphoheptose isomerase [Thaumarchaeota archaeon]|jgi:D-sedoheptulose 7-phosphate isomerase|nr:MAG: phosphoheptose isomerase [Nitrososphaerota archaeon]
MSSTDDIISTFFKEQQTCLDKINPFIKTIEKMVSVLLFARDNNKMIFTMGNGGSGSTASHFVSDLLKTAIIKDSNRFKAISLVDNIPVNLAWANDVSYEQSFAEQLKNFYSKGDIVIGFSGSGNSPNILNAMKLAKNQGCKCIGITGMSGGKLPELCDITITIPSTDMLQIESAHLTLCHCIINVIRKQGTPQFKYE